MEKSEETKFFITNLIDSWKLLTEYITKNPEKLIKSQLKFCHDFQNLSAKFEELSDKRFHYPEWQNNFSF